MSRPVPLSTIPDARSTNKRVSFSSSLSPSLSLFLFGTHQSKTGTGGARHGSRGAPIFRGGGRAHGPIPRSFDFSAFFLLSLFV